MTRTCACRIARLLAATLVLAIAGPALADAPAHGWRKKHDPDYTGYTGRKWDRDYGVATGVCDTRAVGAVLGGVVGGAIGSQVGQGDGRKIAIILGTAIGAVIGSKIGGDIDNTDRGCIGHALELGIDNRPVAWTNAATGLTYRIIPVRGYTQGGLSCREFAGEVRRGKTGKPQDIRGSACRRGEGDWELRGGSP